MHRTALSLGGGLSHATAGAASTGDMTSPGVAKHQAGASDQAPNSPSDAGRKIDPSSDANANRSQFVAPPTFLTRVPDHGNVSLDEKLADFILKPVGQSPSAEEDHPARAPTSPQVQQALDAFNESAERSTALMLASSLVQGFTSSVKRLTQGQ